MKLFFEYIRSKRRTIVGFAFFAAIFAASFALYKLPVTAVIYPLLLCAAAGAVLLVIDFLRVRELHSQLVRIREMTAEMIDSLPPAGDIPEADYREIIFGLQREAAQTQTADNARYREMVEYYTVWAHQIKTPIASMRLALQNEDSPLSRRMTSEVTRIEQYVSMVLAFLRLESPSSDYVFREHRLDDIIKPCLRKFAPDFIGRRIRLEYEPIEDTIVTDEKWLSFVIEQILSNALKYTKEGSVSIYMREPRTLCISDTGIGIAPEDIPRVFEKGYTGCNGRADKSASGIGLYLCRRVCDNLGAAISAQSIPGEGTTICIDLSQIKLTTE